MPPEVFSPAAIREVAAKNPLRQYPSINKGRNRLLPFAQPRIRTKLSFPTNAKFFIAGNCFGRNLEKAIAKADRTYLSSPRDLDLPGSAKEQYNRYNIFNLDVSTNEIVWAIDPNAPSPDDALIQVGEEWVDMQIHWTFAHDQEQARAYRKIYNTSYAGVADADVVILASSGIEQWFDAKTGLYLNGMPTAKMTAEEPDRYEFHRLDVEACEKSFRRAIDVILAHTKVNPIILLTVSPVMQPLVYGQNDAILEQFLAKAYQRTAAENVCRDYSCVEYLPSVEFAMFSDFKYAFQATSINHSTQGLANRIVAEMLLRYEGESPGFHAINAIGQVEALIAAEEYDDAVEVAEKAIAAGAPQSVDFDFQYTQALVRSRRQTRAVDWLMFRMTEVKGEDLERTFALATNLVRSYGTPIQIDALLAYAEEAGMGEETIGLLRKAMASRADAKTQSEDVTDVSVIVDLFKAGDFEQTVFKIEEVIGRSDVSDATVNRLLPLLTRSLMNMDRHAQAMEQLLSVIKTRETALPRWANLLVQIATSRADVAMIDRILSEKEKIGVSDGLAALERRRAFLAERPMSKALEG